MTTPILELACQVLSAYSVVDKKLVATPPVCALDRRDSAIEKKIMESLMSLTYIIQQFTYGLTHTIYICRQERGNCVQGCDPR